MAKRKAARATGRKTTSTRRGAGARRAASRKVAGRKGAAKKSARAAKPARGTKRAGSARAKKATRTQRTSSARKTVRGSTTRRTSRSAATRASRAPAKTTRSAPAKVTAPKTVPARKAPSLNRARRTIAEEDDLVPTPPSSLDLDRSASAIRTGRKGLRDRYAEHTETSPALTGGDVDADWESAYSVGDEAPGGDNPTPDQDIVDDIGRAVGVEYQDNEELKGADKLTKRDRNRWELDPASSDDWDDR